MSDVQAKDINLGDRVRVVIEGIVEQNVPGTGLLRLVDPKVQRPGRTNYTVDTLATFVKGIEVLPPTITTFGPGDHVRSKLFPHYEYTVGEAGAYYSHSNDKVWVNPTVRFTSDVYELVTK